MSRPNPVYLFVFLAAVLVLIGAAELAKGGLFIAKYDGDALHLLDIVTRMSMGQHIHRDVMTPLGVLGFLPFSMLMAMGVPAGTALVGGQLAVGAILLGPIWYVCASRLGRGAAYLAGLYMIVLLVALTHGETDAALSMSMHYNRWAWVLAYLAFLTALIPPRDGGRETLDGALIGVAMAALVLLKITYFIAFLVPVVAALAVRDARRALIAALIAGLAVAVLATVLGGIDFWLAYIADLKLTAESALRSVPGQPMGNIAGGPQFLGANLALLMAVVLFRFGGQRGAGLVLLLTLPAVIYVVVQNFGNDPQWLILLVVVVMTLAPAPGVLSPEGWNLRRLAELTAMAAFAMTLPSFLNMAYSPWRHMWLDASEYVPIVPDDPRFADLGVPKVAFARANAMIALDEGGTGLEKFREFAERRALVSINGEELPSCELQNGLEAWYQTIAGDIEAAGYAGRPVMAADLFDVLYLFGDFPTLQGAAAWYYGGTPGVAAAEFMMVPICPINAAARAGKIEAVEAAGVTLTEVQRTPLYRLYRLEKPGE